MLSAFPGQGHLTPGAIYSLTMFIIGHPTNASPLWQKVYYFIFQASPQSLEQCLVHKH